MQSPYSTEKYIFLILISRQRVSVKRIDGLLTSYGYLNFSIQSYSKFPGKNEIITDVCVQKKFEKPECERFLAQLIPSSFLGKKDWEGGGGEFGHPALFFVVVFVCLFACLFLLLLLLLFGTKFPYKHPISRRSICIPAKIVGKNCEVDSHHVSL